VPTIHPVAFTLQLPPGAISPEAVTTDVRCFLIQHETGVLLVDAGLPGSSAAIGETLAGMSASWDDVSDVVVTHGHFDHIGGLGEVLALATTATVRAGHDDAADVEEAARGRQVIPLESGDVVAGWVTVSSPGHTAGHLGLLHGGDGVLLAGDGVGALAGTLVRAPAMFTADSATAERSLRELAALDVARLVTSHGGELPDGPEQLARLVADVPAR